MRNHEQYAPYRPPLTAEQQELVNRAENPAEAYGRIALDEAKRQLSVATNSGEGKNALPDDAEACFRFPAVDPMGQYSVMELKVSRRMRHIEAALAMRDEEVRALANGILSQDAVNERWKQLRLLSKKHRIYTRAEKLCWDEAAADSLHIAARRLEVESVVAEFDLVLQGVEHLLGIREGYAPREVADFYRGTLNLVLTQEQYEQGWRVVQPEEINVFFQDFDNRILQLTFSEPENWGLSMEELEKLVDET